ncbi:hypothetical protein [Gordonia hankookensis]|uniref:Transcriptional regulator, AbiEi antitoxin, Type IV TA system n=1 Tax=Gordonia hankookensis TaxID=589403 RepID=A0ABR7WEL6_9ACTN|nr:hypothetical protein [Gordonia hankookensis]MBD1321229.1 hypothetical protein [Gordonia hankookensis]
MDDFSRFHHAVNRQELIVAGYTDADLRAATRTGQLETLAPGVLVPAGTLDGTAEHRHRELARAWIRRAPVTGRALGGVSAVAAWGLPVWGLDTDRVVVVDHRRTPGTRTTSVMKLVTDRRPPAIETVDGVPVITAARAVVDVARTAPRIAAIAVGDAALHAGLCTADDLADELDLIDRMSGASRARRVVPEMNGLAESVLESRSRIELVDGGLPVPALQVNLYDSRGRWVARVDFYWEALRTVGECDGKSKYEGPDGQSLMLYEKTRTDALVELGHRVVHWGWHDVDHPASLIARLDRTFRRPAA